jgi:hypothetical protein
MKCKTGRFGTHETCTLKELNIRNSAVSVLHTKYSVIFAEYPNFNIQITYVSYRQSCAYIRVSLCCQCIYRPCGKMNLVTSPTTRLLMVHNFLIYPNQNTVRK